MVIQFFDFFCLQFGKGVLFFYIHGILFSIYGHDDFWHFSFQKLSDWMKVFITEVTDCFYKKTSIMPRCKRACVKDKF